MDYRCMICGSGFGDDVTLAPDPYNAGKFVGVLVCENCNAGFPASLVEEFWNSPKDERRATHKELVETLVEAFDSNFNDVNEDWED